MMTGDVRRDDEDDEARRRRGLRVMELRRRMLGDTALEASGRWLVATDDARELAAAALLVSCELQLAGLGMRRERGRLAELTDAAQAEIERMLVEFIGRDAARIGAEGGDDDGD